MTLFEKDGNPRLLNPTDRSTEERVGPFLFYIKLVWTFDKGVSEGCWWRHLSCCCWWWLWCCSGGLPEVSLMNVNRVRHCLCGFNLFSFLFYFFYEYTGAWSSTNGMKKRLHLSHHPASGGRLHCNHNHHHLMIIIIIPVPLALMPIGLYHGGNPLVGKRLKSHRYPSQSS